MQSDIRVNTRTDTPESNKRKGGNTRIDTQGNKEEEHEENSI